MSRLHTLLEHYGRDHENATNQTIHLVCVPLILWSIIAMVWTIPVPGTWFQPGAFAGFLMAILAAWYFRGSRTLGLGAAATFVGAGALCWFLANAIGSGFNTAGLVESFLIVFGQSQSTFGDRGLPGKNKQLI